VLPTGYKSITNNTAFPIASWPKLYTSTLIIASQILWNVDIPTPKLNHISYVGKDKRSLPMSQQPILWGQKYGNVGNGVHKSESTCQVLVNVAIGWGNTYRNYW
jgi:hypothetical protein